MAIKKQSIKRGDTFVCQFAHLQPDNTPLDLSNCTARLQVRDKSDNLLIDADLTSGLSIPNPIDGIVYCRIEADVMRTIPVGTHFYDLEITYADNTVKSSETINLVVLKDETRTLELPLNP